MIHITKKCPKCGEIKSSTNFNKDKRDKDGLFWCCKECIYFLSKEWIKNNPEKYKQNAKNFRLNNPSYMKEYHKKNKERAKELRRKNDKDNYDNNPNYKLLILLRTRFNQSIKGGRGNKYKSIIDLSGCSLDELKEYISKQFLPEMNWENWGKVWEIDHIILCKFFDLSKIEDQQKCFHYTNLRPLFITTEIAESFGYKGYIGNRNRSKKEI